MTSYDATPQVLINGTSYTGISIDSVSINMGRPDITSQPQPGYASCSLLIEDTEQLQNPIQPMDTFQVKLNNSTGSYVSLFNGYVSDVSTSLAQFGDGNGLIEIAITATGPLANLHRKVAGGTNYPLQNDGDRILAILTDAYLTNWSDVAAKMQDNTTNYSWNQVLSTATWNTYDGVNNALVNGLATSIKTPGQYTLDQYNSGEADAYELATQAADSGRGILTEGPDGAIYYYDYLSRSTPASPIMVSSSDLSAGEMRFASTIGEIVNDLTLSYGSSGTVESRDETSIYKYGQLKGTRSTTLHDATAAQTQADSYIMSRAYARTYPEAFLFELENPNITDSNRDLLISVNNLTKILFTPPFPAFGSTFVGYVENWSWQFSRNRAALKIGCSAYSENYPATVWLQEYPTVTWNTYTATVNWSNA